MRVLQVYNQYRSEFNGEEAVVRRTAELIARNGDQTELWIRSSRDIAPTWKGKLHAFCNGIYSRSARDAMMQRLAADPPDIVHVHNLYPLFSPSILEACRWSGVPVVMTVHNQQFSCPKADHLRNGRVCERCFGGREFHCAVLNCRSNVFESIGYAIRAWVARRMKLFHKNVSMVIALSQFARDRLIQVGFAPDRVVVLPNTVAGVREEPARGPGGYAAFAGRLSPEKGIDSLLEAARFAAEIPVRVAGSGPLQGELESRFADNAIPAGTLEGDALHAFYRGARFLVMPSRTYEMCPMVILEAMSHGLPIIASRLGGQAELVEEGVTGLLFEAGNATDLAEKMRQLWTDPDRCQRLGEAGRQKVLRDYNEQQYFRRLQEIYRSAMERAIPSKATHPAAASSTWGVRVES